MKFQNKTILQTAHKVLSFIILFSCSYSFAQPKKNTPNKVVTHLQNTEKQIDRPNTVYIELLGRSFLYGIGYNRMLSQDVVAGFSFSYVAASLGAVLAETKVKAYSVPLYLNYNFNQSRRHKFLATGGLNIFSFEVQAKANDQVQTQLNQQVENLAAENDELDQVLDPNSLSLPDLKLTGSGTLAFPQVGVGYEYRAQNGFYGNSNLYATYVIDRVIPWLGLSFGVGF